MARDLSTREDGSAGASAREAPRSATGAHADFGHPPPRILVYALGGGRGHAVRGSALTAGLRRHGADAVVVLPESKADVARELGAPALLLARAPDAPSLAHAIDGLLEQHRADLMIVDVFAEGLYDEFRLLRTKVPRAALLRCRRDRNSQRLLRGVANSALALDLEAHLRWRPLSLRATPFSPVIRPLSAALPVVDVLLVASEPALVATLERVGNRLVSSGIRVALTSAERLTQGSRHSSAFPLPPEVLCAPVVVAPAGYNLTYELCALRGWHIALPRTRPFDDQSRRARALGLTVAGPGALIRLIDHLLEERPPRPRGARIASADALALHLLRWWWAFAGERTERRATLDGRVAGAAAQPPMDRV